MGFPKIVPLPLSARQYRFVALLLLLMLASALTEGFGLLLLVPMLGLLGEQAGGSSPITDALTTLGVPISLSWLLTWFVVLVVLRAVLVFTRQILAYRFEVTLVDGLRDRAWRALLHSNWRHLSSLRQSDSASLLISNIDRIGFGINRVLNAIAIIVTLLGVGLAALAISPVIALVSAVLGVAILLAYRGLRRRASALGDELTRAHNDVYARLNEGLGALRVIKSFGNEEQAALSGASAFAGLRRTQLAFIRDAGLAQAALQVLGALLLAGLVWFAISRWGAGATQILPLVALFARALPLIGSLQQNWQQWAHARPAIVATMDLIDTAEREGEARHDTGLVAPALKQSLVLDNVSVKFESRDRAALEAIDLVLPAGSITAISGPSGAGKSTLADVLGGLISPDAGSVQVDGMSLEGGMRRSWRERVTYVQQDPVLFTGTIRENLHWADAQASSERLHDVLRAASANFVHDLPQGLDTLIGESGQLLSGGERQRLVLARALLRDPVLLILDEASSALDIENEQAIARAVTGLSSRMTIVIIGHRGVLGDTATREIRLENGRIVAENT